MLTIKRYQSASGKQIHFELLRKIIYKSIQFPWSWMLKKIIFSGLGFIYCIKCSFFVIEFLLFLSGNVFRSFLCFAIQDGICLCVQVQFPRGLGGQKRTICRKYMRNFGPIFNETLLQPSKITQVPIPANCIPIANTTNFTFDPMLAYGPYKPIKYNVEYG